MIAVRGHASAPILVITVIAHSQGVQGEINVLASRHHALLRARLAPRLFGRGDARRRSASTALSGDYWGDATLAEISSLTAAGPLAIGCNMSRLLGLLLLHFLLKVLDWCLEWLAQVKIVDWLGRHVGKGLLARVSLAPRHLICFHSRLGFHQFLLEHSNDGIRGDLGHVALSR